MISCTPCSGEISKWFPAEGTANSKRPSCAVQMGLEVDDFDDDGSSSSSNDNDDGNDHDDIDGRSDRFFTICSLGGKWCLSGAPT